MSITRTLLLCALVFCTAPLWAGEYLVICDDDLLESLDSWVEMREEQEHTVRVEALSKAGNTPFLLKRFIREQYQKSPFTFLLLVGEPENLPQFDWDGYSSDYWYSCLEGDDLIPEVAVGRFCASTSREVENYIAKIRAYEGPLSGAFASKTLLVSHQGDDFEKALEKVVETPYKQKPAFTHCKGSDPANTNATIIGNIESGQALVLYRGQGSRRAWYGWNGSDFDYADIGNMNNAVFPVIFSISRYNCAISGNMKTFSESCVNNKNGGGSAFFGSTGISHHNISNDMCLLIFEACFEKGLRSIGNITNYASKKLIEKYGEGHYALENLRTYMWLGDPGMRLRIPGGTE